MKTAKTGGQDPRLAGSFARPSTQKAAEESASAPIQKDISNWERDLVAQRSAQRRQREGQIEVRHGITILSAVAGVGLLLIGQPLLAIAAFGSGILISPGLDQGPRNDGPR